MPTKDAGLGNTGISRPCLSRFDRLVCLCALQYTDRDMCVFVLLIRKYSVQNSQLLTNCLLLLVYRSLPFNIHIYICIYKAWFSILICFTNFVLQYLLIFMHYRFNEVCVPENVCYYFCSVLILNYFLSVLSIVVSSNVMIVVKLMH